MSLELLAAAGSVLLGGSVVDVSVEPGGPFAGDLGATVVTLQDASGDTTAFRVPGDNHGRTRVFGVPRFVVGSEWMVELVDGPRGLVPKGLGAGLHPLGSEERWNVNDTVLRPELLPLTWRLVAPGSDDLGQAASEAAIDRAFAQWNAVGCSSLEFLRADTYTADDIEPGDSWLRWEEDEWEQDPAIAGVAGLFFEEVDGEFVPAGATIVFNGVSWTWVAGPGNAYLPAPRVNIDSVVVHEVGHAAGLAHEPGLVAATMFYAYLGGDWQASIAGDDRRGLCDLYPNGANDCEVDGDCADRGDGLVCVDIDGIRVCDEPRDGVGADCSVEDINCGEYCVLDRPEDGAGYCSVRCEAGDCPDGFVCGLVDDVYVPLEDSVPLCFPFDPPQGDDDDTAGDDDGEGCNCDGGGAAMLPLFGMLGLRLRREARPA